MSDRGAEQPGPELPGVGPVLATTLQPSPYPADPLVRTRLLNLLTAGVQQAPLTLVSAPPGAGKTVLAASWFRARPVPWPAAWLSLDETSAQPAPFWAHLAATLSRTGVPLPATADPPALGVDSARFLTALAADLLRCPHPLVLVLDGAEHLAHREVARGLDTLLRDAGTRLRLVLCARGDPRMPLHRYRLAGSMSEIRTAALAFDEAEAQALFTAAGVQVSRAAVAAAVQQTQGWAAGIRLAAAALREDPDPQRCLPALEHDDGSIGEYLRAEVLQAQPLEVQRALLRSSVSDRLWPELLDQLTERTDGRRTLAALARANAFVERCPDSAGEYRVHPLFRRCLAHLLAAEAAPVLPELHRRSAVWFAAHSPVTAAQHAGAAEDWAHATTLLTENVGAAALLLGEDGAAHDVLGALPETTHGEAAAVLHLTREVRADHPVSVDDLARLRAVALDPLASPALTTSAAAVHAAATGQLLQEASDPQLLALAAWARARSALQGERLDTAAESLRAALALSQTGDAERVQRECAGDLALAEALRGQLNSALRLAATAEALAERASVAPADRATTPALALAWAHTEQHELPAAQHWLRVSDQRVAASPWLHPLLAAAQARVHRLHRRLSAAEWALTEHGAAPAPAWMSERVATELGLLHLLRDQPQEALAAMGSARGGGRAEAVRARAQAEVAARAGAAPAGRLPPEDGVDLDLQVQGWLAAAAADVTADLTARAVERTERALALAEPEQLRRPFVEAPSAVRQLLDTDPRLRSATGWLQRTPPEPAAPERPPSAQQCTDTVSERELEVLRHLADMLSTEEIGARMYISVHTVRTHVRSILRKLEVRRRNEAVRRARELGLI